MDGFEQIGKFEKLKKTEKLDKFESLENNKLSVKETIREAGPDGKKVSRYETRQYNILQEEDFNEKSWDLMDLVKEQEELRNLEGESKFLDAEYAHRRAKFLAQKYTALGKKDRRSSFKKYQKIMNGDMKKLIDAYKKRKTSSIKDEIAYESQMIRLNAEAREHLLTGTMKDAESLKVNLAHNRMRMYYRLLRMYVVHLNDPRITAKEKTKYTAEMNKIRTALNDEFKEVWAPGKNDMAKARHKWARIAGKYEMGIARTAQETSALREEYETEEQQERIDKMSDKEIEKQAEDILKEMLPDGNKQQDKKQVKKKKTKSFKFKNNQAAWDKFMRTGVWDPMAKKADDPDSVDAEKVEGEWHIGRSYEVIKALADDPEVKKLPDRVFKQMLIVLNQRFTENWKEFSDSVKGEKDKGSKKADRKTGGWRLKLQKDYEELLNWTLDTKGKTKEIREQKRAHKKQKNAEYNALISLMRLDPAYYPEVEDTIRDMYYSMFHTEAANYAKDTSGLFSALSHHNVDAFDGPELKKLMDMAKRKDILDDKLKLGKRGSRIYQSAVVHKIIVSDEATDDVMNMLIAHAQGMEKLMNRMIDAKFGPLTRSGISDGLLSFLGEKGLVSSYREIRDLTEQYLSGLSITNIKAARLDADYRDAVGDMFKGGLRSFGEDFDTELQSYLSRCGFSVDSAKDKCTADLKKYLKPVKEIISVYNDTIRDVTLSAAGWKKLQDYVRKNINGMGPVNITRTPMKITDDLKKEFESRLHNIINADKGKTKVTYKAWKGEYVSRKKKNKGADIEDFSYRSMLAGIDLLESQEVTEIITDAGMRQFLAENLDKVLIGNEELNAKFPILKKITSLDQLDDIAYTDFVTLLGYLKENFTSNAGSIRKLLEQSTAEDERIELIQKQTLLKLLKSKGDGKTVNMSKFLQEELKRMSDEETLKRMRLQYTIGRQGTYRDGRIHYRFEDMPDRDKSLLQDYLGKGKNWMKQRLKKMDQAAAAWRRMDELNPAASLQLKKWFAAAYNDRNAGKERNTLLALANILKGDTDLSKHPEFKIDKALAADYAKAGGQDLLGDIRTALAGDEKADITSYITELSLCDTQDIMYSHGGIFQGGVFCCYGDDHSYRKMLREHARFAQKRVALLDKYLEKYKGNPSVMKSLRDKLLPAWIGASSDVHELQKELAQSVNTLAGIAEENMEAYAENEEKLEAIEDELNSLTIKESVYGTKEFDEKSIKELMDKLNKKYEADKKKYEKKIPAYDKLKDAWTKTQESYASASVALETLKKEYEDEKDKSNKSRLKKKLDAQTKLVTDLQAKVNALQKSYATEHEAMYTEMSKLDMAKDRIDGQQRILKLLDQKQRSLNAREILKTVNAEIKAGQKDKAAKISENMSALIAEYDSNTLLNGYDNLDQMAAHLTDCIDKNGDLKSDVVSSVRLFEEKRKALEDYKGGELARFWEFFINNDKIFSDLISGNDFIQQSRMEKLYDLLAPLARAAGDANAFIAEYFIQDNLAKIMDDDCKDESIEKMRKDLAEISKKPVEKDKKGNFKDPAKEYWASQIAKYESVYYEKTCQGTKSISENMTAAAKSIQKDLAKTLMYKSEDVKSQFGMQKAKYRKWWFRTSANTGVELMAQKNGQFRHQIALDNAESILLMMTQTAMNEEEGVRSLNNLATAKEYFGKLRDRFQANDEAAEIAFLRHILAAEHDIVIPDDVNAPEAIEKALSGFSADAQADMNHLLTSFKMHVRNLAVNTETAEFKNSVEHLAIQFLQDKRNEEADFDKEKKKQKEELDAKLEYRRGEQNKVLETKYAGRKKYDTVLFGGNSNMLDSFGRTKQALGTTPEKAKQNKAVKSRGEETNKEWLEAAGEYFELSESDKIRKHEPYPDILKESLDEFIRLHRGYVQRAQKVVDTIGGWISSDIQTIVQVEADRLKLIYDSVRKLPEKQEGELPMLEDMITHEDEEVGASRVTIPDEFMDMFIVYASRFGSEGAKLTAKEINKLAARFMTYAGSIRLMDEVSVKHPALKYAFTDALEKDKAYLYATPYEKQSDEDAKEFEKRIKAQVAYFAHADKVYSAIDKAIDEDKYMKDLDDASRERYRHGLREYFTGQIIDESVAGTEFDESKYVTAALERIRDSEAREALVVVGTSVSSEDYENLNDYPGQMTAKDLERAIFATRKKDLLKKYNALDDDERKIFAMALYCSNHTETGSQRVIYGQSAAMLKEERAQILAYMKGEEVDFKVDYARAMRTVTTKYKRTKIHGDSEAFEAALDFLEKIKNRKEALRPKDWKRITDTPTVVEEASKLRFKGVAKKSADIPDQAGELDKLDINDRKGFMELIMSYSESDTLRQQSEGIFTKLPRKYIEFRENYPIDKVVNRLNNLKPAQMNLLIYVLQDRSALDFSTAGKDKETKIIPHANQEKRFELIDKLMTGPGRFDALTKAASPAFIRQAMKSLLSFQVRDDKELTENGLTEDDFNQRNLYRSSCIDWELLTHAIDLLDELEREQRKIMAVRQAPYQVISEAANYVEGEKKSKAVEFYRSEGDKIRGANTMTRMDEVIRSAYIRDKKDLSDKLNPGNWFKDGKELDDMMAGYRGLTKQQKILFVRALQHRDLLDVSQKNLYWNFFGLAERDFVNPKERDALIDKYIEETITGEKKLGLDGATYDEAILSLLSTQVNDDMKFEKVEGSNWAYKNINVDNQLLVTDQRSSTIIDWKLFKRALQFVTRATNERKMTAGDEALYKYLGDTAKLGVMKFDRKYLRRNLHNTGSRFMRFLAKEGYSEIKDNLGFFEKIGDYSEYIVSTKTANYIHEQVNKLALEEAEEAEEEEEEAEEQEAEEEENKEKKKSFEFLKGLADMASAVTDQYDKLNKMKNDAADIYGEFKEVLKEEEEEEEKEDDKKDELDNELEGVEGLPEKTDYIELVNGYAEKISGWKESLDELAGDEEKLKKLDGYIQGYLTDKISATKLAGWYTTGEEWVNDKKDAMLDFMNDDKISDGLKNKLNSVLDNLSTSAAFLDAAKEYFDAGIDLLGDFKNIVESAKNIMELEATREEAAELKGEDDEKIDNAVKEKNINEKDQKKLKEAQNNNVALMNANTTMNKSIQGRAIVNSVAELTKKGLNLAGIEAGEILEKAADLVNFFYKCVSDRKSLIEYYKTGAMGQVARILRGKSENETDLTNSGFKTKGKTYTKDENGQYNLDFDDINMLMNASGFERMDEFADYLRLNMVHSLLFSASKFNPLKQPKLIATTALKILGMEDAIDKTDSDTALKLFHKLQA